MQQHKTSNGYLRMKINKGDIVFDNCGQWYEVKDVRRDDGFIAIRRASGAWEYRDPKYFKKHA